MTDKQERDFKSYLESIGDSIVVVADDEITKVHVHTNDPGLAIQRALTYGALSRMKIDNMREEHQEKLIKDAVRQQYENLKSDFSRYELSIVWNRPLNHTFTLSTDIGWQHCRFRNHNYSDRITVGCSLKF